MKSVCVFVAFLFLMKQIFKGTTTPHQVTTVSLREPLLADSRVGDPGKGSREVTPLLRLTRGGRPLSLGPLVPSWVFGPRRRSP